MSYIGNSFTSQQFTPAVDYFNGNASTTAFTLSKTVGSVYDIQVVIENVPQNPASAFTVSGNVITFTSAPPTGTNNIYVRYTSPMTNVVKPAPGTVSPTEINSSYSLWNLSGSTINYTAGNVGIGTTNPIAGTGFTTDRRVLQIIPSSGTANAQVHLGGVSGTILDHDDSNNTISTLRNLYGASSASALMQFQSGYMTFGTGTSYTEAMRIRSDGNVGISCLGSANYKLQVASVTPNQEVVCITTLNTNTGTGLAGEGPLMLQNTNTTNNNMAAISNFDANGYINNQINFINTDHAGGGAIAFTTRTNGGGSYGERMRILQDGAICFGTTTFGGTLGISMSNLSDSTSYGKSMYFNSPYNGTRNAISFAYNSSGVGQIVTGTSSVSYASNSDYRLKENVLPITGALAKVTALKPVTYNWKIDGADGEGFIAHELQEVCPLAVHGEKDAVEENGKIIPQSIDPSKLVATLTAAIQEQQAIIENLKSRIEVLEAK
jgi:hypothetical protein